MNEETITDNYQNTISKTITISIINLQLDESIIIKQDSLPKKSAPVIEEATKTTCRALT